MTTAESILERPASGPTFKQTSGARKAKDWAATVLVWLAFIVAVIPLVWVLWTVVAKGTEALTTSTWFTNSLYLVGPTEVAGGVYHAIIGTLLQGLICAVIAVPLGIFCAIYLVEYGRGRLARTVTFMVDILSGVPSIVAALFIYALWITMFGMPRSALAVSLALVLLMLPIVIRSSEEMLRLVPDELREASYALGVPKWKTIAKIVLPTAFSGIVTGIMLSVARVMGETAPALILVAYSDSINFNVFEGNMANLPLVVMDQLNNDQPAGELRIWGAALTLIIIVMLVNLAATAISKFSALKTK